MLRQCQTCARTFQDSVWPYSSTTCKECFVKWRAERIREGKAKKGPRQPQEPSSGDLEVYRACAEGRMNKTECARQLGLNYYTFYYRFRRWVEQTGTETVPPDVAPRRSRTFPWEENGCERCGRQDERTLEGKKLCAECYQESYARTREKVREKYQARKGAGLCISCGKQDERTLSGLTQCASCYQKQQTSAQVRRAEHKCRNCGSVDERTLAGKSQCARCLAYDSRMRKLKRAGGIVAQAVQEE